MPTKQPLGQSSPNPIEFLRREAGAKRSGILLRASLAGIANAFLLKIVSDSAKSPSAIDLHSVSLFLLSFGVYVLCARHTYYAVTEVLESALHGIKIRLTCKIERAELRMLERIGLTEVHDRLMENLTTLASTADPLAHLLQSISITACMFLYILVLSPPAALTLVILLGLSYVFSLPGQKALKDHLAELSEERLSFFKLLTDLVAGSKEVKLSRKRGQQIKEDLEKTSLSVRTVTIKTNKRFADNMQSLNVTFIALIGTIVYVLPQHFAVTEDLSQIVAAVLFLWRPLTGIYNGISPYFKSRQALINIHKLESKLDSALQRGATMAQAAMYDPWHGQIQTIEVAQLQYQYDPEPGTDELPFHIGPVGLTLAAGEAVFIVGGNGSGKSTFLKVLNGLYPLSAGSLRVNSIQVTPQNVAAYRELFSAIYSDFHLFSKLYGVLDAEPETVSTLLKEMHLAGKTQFKDQRFSRQDLSTGQRKRLAMIVALLEDRPICIFDEWAADQDPVFRKSFYEELIPRLKQQGKIVIVVSHDDRYFCCADQVVVMEQGLIRSIERPRGTEGRNRPPQDDRVLKDESV